MTIERIELLILRILNDAPQHHFTTEDIFADVNGSSDELVRKTEIQRALDNLAAATPPQVVRIPGTERGQGLVTMIAGAGIFRVLKAPSDK
jgi:hypothetical protein